MAELLAETKYEVKTVSVGFGSTARMRKGGALYLILGAIWTSLMAAWMIVMLNQTGGNYLCQTIHVQFEDDFVSALGAFSGLYEIDSGRIKAFSDSRARYVDRQSGKAVFAYCKEMKAWTFGFAEDGHFPDPCDDWVGKYCTASVRTIPTFETNNALFRRLTHQPILRKRSHMIFWRLEDWIGLFEMLRIK